MRNINIHILASFLFQKKCKSLLGLISGCTFSFVEKEEITFSNYKNTILLKNLFCLSLKVLFVVLWLFLFSIKVHGQAASATWALTTNQNASNSGNISGNASTYAGQTYSAIDNSTFGAGSCGSNTCARGLVLNTVSGNSGTSRNINTYYEFSLLPSSGFNFIISSVSFCNYNNNSTYNGIVFYSTDNFATENQLGSSFTNPASPTCQSFSSLSINVTNGNTIKFRVYFYNIPCCYKTGISYFIVSGTTSVCSAETPGVPTSNTPQCNNVTLTKNGTPATNNTWYWQTSSTGTSTSNSAASTYSAASSSTYYIRSYHSSGACWGTAASVAVTVDPTSVGGTVSGGASVCTGTNSTILTLSGHTGSITKWQYSTVSDFSSAVTDVVNATTTLTASNLTATRYYRAVVTSGSCSAAYSSTATVTVNALPSISSQPSAATICVGGTFSPNITAAGGSSLTYQWKYCTTSNGTYSNVTNSSPTNATYSNATTNSLSVSGSIAAGSAYYYQCIVSDTGNGCTSVTSSAVQLTINSDPIIGTQPIAVTECVGGTGAMSVVASGGTPSLSYQWYTNGSTNSNSGGSSIGSATSSSYTVPSITAGTTYYYVLVSATGSGCTSVTSSAVAGIINSVPSIGTQPATLTECVGGNGTISVVASGGTPSLTYQWYSNGSTNSNSGGSSIGSATSSSYTIPSTSSGTVYYYVVVSASGSGCTSVTSSAVAGTINADPSIFSQPSSSTICYNVGSTYTPSVTVTGGVTLTYQWQYNTTGSTWASVTNGAPTYSTYSGGISNSLTVSGAIAAGTYNYRCIVSDAGNGCTASITSSTGVLTIAAAPTSNAGSNQTISYCRTATLAADSPSNGTGAWSVSSGPSTNSSQFSNVNLYNAVFTPAGGNGSYVLTWTVSNSPCTSATSNVTITVSAPNTRYYVANNGWGSTSSWSATSGGTAGASLPVCGDNIVIEVTGNITPPSSGDATSYSSLTISSNGNVSFTGLGSTITLGGASGYDFIVSSSSNFTLDANSSWIVKLVLANNSSAKIDGTLNFIHGGSTKYSTIDITNASSFIVSSTGVINNPETNTTLIGYNPTILTINGTYNYQANGGTVPAATWGASSNCVVTGQAGSGINGTNQNFGNFTWNCLNQSNASQTLASGFACQGNLTIYQNATNFYVTTSTDLVVGGNLIIGFSGTGGSTAKLALGSSNYTLSVAGTTSINGTLDLNSGTGSKTFTGNFTILAGGTLTEGGPCDITFGGDFTNNGTFTNTLNSTGKHIFSGTTTTIGGSGTNTMKNVTFIGGGAKTLSALMTVQTLLTLTSGKINTDAINLLYVSATGAGSISGTGSITNMINGPLKWALTNSSTYVFPVGSGSSYLPLTFRTLAGNTTPIITVQANASASNGTSTSGNVSSTEYWQITYSGTIGAGTTTLDKQLSISSNSLVGTASSLGGVYTSLGGSVSGTSVTSVSNSSPVTNGTTQYYAFISPLIITTTGVLSAFTTCSGVNSLQQSFTVSGTNLTSNLVITSPTGFEVSTSLGSGYASSFSLTPSSGSVSLTSVYVRTTTASSGSFSGNIVCSSAGATSQNVSASGTVNTLPTVSMASSSLCVGNTVALSPSTQGSWTSNNTTYATVVSSTGVVTGVASGALTFTYTLTSTGCSATTTSLQVNSPQVSVNTNLTQGQLVWNGAVNGDWTNPSNWLSYNVSGVYSIPTVAPTATSSIVVPLIGTCVINSPSISSSTVYVKDVLIESGAILSMGNSSILNIAGSFVNNGVFTAGSGNVVFTGGFPQTISGNSPVFNNLTISNTAGDVFLAVSTSVLGTLTLSSGKLNVQGFTLTIGSSSTDGTISGGKTSSYIIAYDSGSSIGYLKHFVNANNVLHSYPIGDLTNYVPLTFTLTANSGLSGAYFTVYTKNVKIPSLNISFSSYLKRYWEGVSSGMTLPTYSISYIYTDDDVSGSESNLQPVKKSGTTWYKPSGATFTTGQTQGVSTLNTTTNTLSWIGLTTFSTYSGAGDQMVALPIETVMFKGEKTSLGNKLEWRNESEHQNSFFTIEKTIDGEIFEIVGKVDGAGSANKVIDYAIIDNHFINEINYYRLIRTNFDGFSVKTDLISIDNRKEESLKVVAYETNILGQEINEFYRGLIIVVYTDGSSLKVIR